MARMEELLEEYAQRLEIGREEYEEAQQRLAPEEFSRRYRKERGSFPGPGIYEGTERYYRLEERQPGELQLLVLYDLLREARAARRELSFLSQVARLLLAGGAAALLLGLVSVLFP